MNVIFLDFDGVINTYHNNTDENIEKRIKILSDLCKKYDCKIVISSSIKEMISSSLETDLAWVKNILNLFKKYSIECIGKTDSISKKLSENICIPTWKDDEIIDYISKHPSIKHFCVLDDYDLKIDLEKVKDYLVKTSFCSDNINDEGLQTSHDVQIGEVLKKDNKIKKMLLNS